MRRTRLNPISKKRAAQMREYIALRRAYLKEHPFCELCILEGGNTLPPRATDIHHKKGRSGAMLLDTTHWMAVCRASHRKIHDNPKWAYENGYLLRK